MRLLVVSVCVALLALSCGDASDDLAVPDSSSTSAPTTAAPSPSTEVEPPVETTDPPPETTLAPFPDPPVDEPEFEDVSLLRCLDFECSRVQKVRLDEAQVTPPMMVMPGVKDITVKNVMERADGRPLVLAEWFTPHVADDAWDDQMVLYSCDDAACSSVTTQVVMDGANYWSGALLSDGSLAIVYQSGRQLLCDVDGCVEPDRTDLSSLELLLCSDPDDCSVGSGRIVVLDRIGQHGLWGGGVVVGADGAPAVLYTRETGPEVHEVRLARCSDTRCADVTTRTVLEAELADLLGVATMPDGSPVFTRSRSTPDLNDSSLVICADVACTAVSIPIVLERTFGGEDSMLAGVAASPETGVIVAVIEFPGQEVRTMTCLDRECASPQQSPVLTEIDYVSVGPARLSLASDGRPMFTVTVGAPEMGEEEHILYVACDDPACSSATTVTLDDPSLVVDQWEADKALGLMVYPHNARWS